MEGFVDKQLSDLHGRAGARTPIVTRLAGTTASLQICQVMLPGSSLIMVDYPSDQLTHFMDRNGTVWDRIPVEHECTGQFAFLNVRIRNCVPKTELVNLCKYSVWDLSYMFFPTLASVLERDIPTHASR